MGILTTDLLEKPYNDEKMEYDYEEQRYVPLVDGITKHAYINITKDWRTTENAQSYLDLLSRVLYEKILSFTDVRYRYKTKWYLAHSKKTRGQLFALMCDTAWYNRRDGGFMMAYNSGANLNQGKMIEFGIDKALSSIATQIVKNSFLGTRFLPMDISTIKEFDTFDEVIEYLVSETYITQEQADEVTAISELPNDDTYRVYEDINNKYIFKDLKTLKKAMENLKIYNENGTW